MSDLSPTQTLMSHREFRLLASGQLLSALGDGAALVAISFALMHATGSISALGWVLGARYSCLGALLLYSGVLADRMPRRPLLIGSDLSRFTAQAALALLLVTGHAGLVACIALQAAYGAAEAFSTPAFRGLVPQIVPPELFRQANVVGEITLNTSRVIGPALGGLLVMVAGASGAIAFDAATFLLSALLVAQMRPPGPPRELIDVAELGRDPHGLRPGVGGRTRAPLVVDIDSHLHRLRRHDRPGDMGARPSRVVARPRRRRRVVRADQRLRRRSPRRQPSHASNPDAPTRSHPHGRAYPGRTAPGNLRQRLELAYHRRLLLHRRRGDRDRRRRLVHPAAIPLALLTHVPSRRHR